MEIKELIKLCRDSNAGVLTVVGKDTNHKAMNAIIILEGSGTQEVLDAINTVTSEWDKDSEAGAITEASLQYDKEKGVVSAGYKEKI